MKKTFIARALCYIFLLNVCVICFLSRPGMAETKKDITLHLADVPTDESDELMPNQTWLDEIEAKDFWSVWEDNQIEPGNDIVVALLDTGVKVSHPDIADSLWTNQKELEGTSGVDDDGNGYIDDIYGVNLANSFYNMTDSYGHGTQMAGAIAMKAGNGGGAGLAYGCKIMSVKCSTDNNFDIDTVIEGIEYAVSHGADVINMSFGTTYDDEDLHEAIKEASKSCVIVAAAGNESVGITTDADGKIKDALYPAAYPEVIGVMASEGTSFASFSNWDENLGDGTDYDIVAPGSKIYTTSVSKNYDVSTGTSIATAIVSAAVADFENICSGEDSSSPIKIKEKFLACMNHKIAKNLTGSSIEYPFLNMKDIAQFAVESDFVVDCEEPSVVNETSEQVKAGGELLFSVRAKDNISVQSVMCYYKLPGSDEWVPKELEKSDEEVETESSQGDLYSAKISLPETAGTALYYITATDGTGTGTCGTADNPKTALCYKEDLSKLTPQAVQAQFYTGAAITPQITLYDGEIKLVEGTDYELSFEDNIKVGTALIYAKGKGVYVGTTFTYFFIKESEIQATAAPQQTDEPLATDAPRVTVKPSDGGTDGIGGTATPSAAPVVSPSAKTTTSVQIAKIKKITRCRFIKKLSLVWKKTKGKADGYIIYISHKKNKAYKKVAISNKTKLNIKLKAKWKLKKKLYVKIAAFRKVGGRRYYGVRSKEKKVKGEIC